MEKKKRFETYPQWLRQLLHDRSLTQQDLAEMLGLRQSQISNWLHEKSLPSYHTLRRMCKELNVTADEILLLYADEVTDAE